MRNVFKLHPKSPIQKIKDLAKFYASVLQWYLKQLCLRLQRAKPTLRWLPWVFYKFEPNTPQRWSNPPDGIPHSSTYLYKYKYLYYYWRGQPFSPLHYCADFIAWERDSRAKGTTRFANLEEQQFWNTGYYCVTSVDIFPTSRNRSCSCNEEDGVL